MRGRDLAARHLEAAVADERDDRQIGPRELGRDRGGQAEAHGRPAVGDQKVFGACAAHCARDLVRVRADIEGEDAVARQDAAHDIDRCVRA